MPTHRRHDHPAVDARIRRRPTATQGPLRTQLRRELPDGPRTGLGSGVIDVAVVLGGNEVVSEARDRWVRRSRGSIVGDCFACDVVVAAVLDRRLLWQPDAFDVRERVLVERAAGPSV